MRIVPLILVGYGGVGKAFLEQIEADARRTASAVPIRFLTAGIVTSRRVTRFDRVARQAVDETVREPGDWECVLGIARAAETLWLASPVIVDATAADNAHAHLRWVEEGFTVVTANKLPLTGDLETFRRLTTAIDRRGHRSYWFEATVGAGLPVIHTVRRHMETGDRITRIDAVLSGTLNFLCDAHARSEPFGAAVLSAMAKGLAEPDPREDLACADVARKAMILGRLAGMPIVDAAGLRIERLLADAETGASKEDYIKGLQERKDWPAPWPDDGDAYEYVVTIVPAEGRLRGRLKPRHLQRTPLVGAENRFAITTERASGPPILIRGPGAGRDVTATAMFGDLLGSIARL